MVMKTTAVGGGPESAKHEEGSKTREGTKLTRRVEFFVVVAADKVKDHQLIKKAMKGIGVNHLVSSVFNGEQLVSLLQSKDYYHRAIPVLPHIIFLDLRLPLMSGMQVMREIRMHAEWQAIRICLVGDISENIRNEARAHDVELFLPRPLTEEQVLELARSVLGNTQ